MFSIVFTVIFGWHVQTGTVQVTQLTVSVHDAQPAVVHDGVQGNQGYDDASQQPQDYRILDASGQAIAQIRR